MIVCDCCDDDSIMLNNESSDGSTHLCGKCTLEAHIKGQLEDDDYRVLARFPCEIRKDHFIDDWKGLCTMDPFAICKYEDIDILIKKWNAELL